MAISVPYFLLLAPVCGTSFLNLDFEPPEWYFYGATGRDGFMDNKRTPSDFSLAASKQPGARISRKLVASEAAGQAWTIRLSESLGL